MLELSMNSAPSPRLYLRLFPALCGLGLGILGCTADTPPPSNLSKKAESQEAAQPAPSHAAGGDAPVAGGDARPPAGADAQAHAQGDLRPASESEPGDPIRLLKAGAKDGPTARLRLALPAATTYEITTVGMVQYPSMPKATGFARRELLRVDTCDGDGDGRTCTLEHRITNFEAEPPYGQFITADEAPVRDLVSRVRVDSRGLSQGPATIAVAEGDDNADAAKGSDKDPDKGVHQELDAETLATLAEVDRLYCIRFPADPIAVGAAWKVSCTVRNDGRISRRDATWEVRSIDTSGPEGHTRVELQVVGTTATIGAKTSATGSFAGTLFFFADIGEPHLLREEIITEVARDGGIRTTARLNYQFAKRRGDALLRTDGEPFPEAPPASDAPAAPPAPSAPPSSPTPR